MNDQNDDNSGSKPISKIPTGKFARGFKLASLTASLGAQALGTKMSGMFSDEAEKNAKKLLSQIKQATAIADTLSQMKGAAMKLGQILSLHGEDLFPKEVIAVLSKLQQNSVQMQFSEIEKVLIRELGKDYSNLLTHLSKDPIAAASIGQVHQAVVDGVPVAVKVQYPGVDQSIDSDIDSLAGLLGVLTKLPNLDNFTAVADEVKMVLKQETDYLQEGKNLEMFRAHFANDETLVLPEYFPKASTKHILTTELLSGITVQEFAESTASPQARALLGKKYLEVFYNELFVLGKVQTDPNFGNYKIQWSFGRQDPKLVLLDFGAVKTFTEKFREDYRSLIHCAFRDDYDGIRHYAIESGFLTADDPDDLVRMHYDLLKLFMEPFQTDEPFKWGENDLADRIRKFMPKFVMAFKLRPPPKDFVFLNRKVVGVYFFSQAVKAEFSPRQILMKYSGFKG